MTSKNSGKKQKSQDTAHTPSNSQKNNRKCELLFTSVSYKDIVSEHFGTATTKISGSSVSLGHHKENNNVELIDKKKQPTNDTRAEYFFDSKKSKVKLWPIMMDHTTDNVLSLFTNKPCRNCHQPYESHPLGCPISYFPHEPSPENPKRIKIEAFLKENNFSTDETDYFGTEQMFCSFPCMKSYILYFLSINPQSYKYTNALSYMYLLYKKIFNITGNEILIPSANPIEVLSCYGGHLNIDEYRECMGVLKFDHTVTTKRPLMFATSSYLEESECLVKKVV